VDNISPMRFCYIFVEFFENHGIFDEFDPEQNRMVTSKGVKNLYEIAKELLPERLPNDEAAQKMRDLSDDEREFLIGNDEDGVVVDMRDYFAEEMAANGGARGLLHQIATAYEQGDTEFLDDLLDKAKEFNEKEL